MTSVTVTAIWQRFLLKNITQDAELNYPGLLCHMSRRGNWLKVSENKHKPAICDIIHKTLQYTHKQQCVLITFS